MIEIRKERAKYDSSIIKIQRKDEMIGIDRIKFISYVEEKSKIVSEKKKDEFYFFLGAIGGVKVIFLNSRKIGLCFSIDAIGRRKGEYEISENKELFDIVNSSIVELRKSKTNKRL